MKRTYAVKEIATFLYSTGDLTNEFFQNHSQIDGKKAHLHLQRLYNDDSQKEYYIKYTFNYKNDEITVHGFIDGVLKENGNTILEEIKSTREELKKIDLDYHQEHLSQLKLYAYLYGLINNMSIVPVRLTYISVDDYKTKKFNFILTIDELKDFFYKSIDDYTRWHQTLSEASTVKLDTLKDITFPFANKRQGQSELMKATYLTMKANSILYAIAPTGIGKTMATIFSTLKSMTKPNEKLFYLTAKTIGREVAIDSFRMLQNEGLKLHAIVISSKAKSCASKMQHCDPEKCSFAKGYFSRLRQAIEDIYTNEILYNQETIMKYALKYNICPFEYSLDLSYFCDAIICDYNYVFDPKAHLIRYFEDTEYQPKILCDESHNLVERSKDMYSAEFDSLLPLRIEEKISSYDKTITKNIRHFYDEFKKYDDLVNKDLFYYSHLLDDLMLSSLKQIVQKAELVLADNKEIKDRDEILTDYFLLKDFVDTAEFFGQSHMFVVKKIEDNHFQIEIKCADASDFIYDTVKNKTKGIVFFSATLFPLKYYMDLLTKGNGKYINLPSPFPQANLDLIIKDDVSTRYKDREATILDIAHVIEGLVNSKKGNYIAFFPSYKYIEMVLSHLDIEDSEVIIQKPNMDDSERDRIFNKFKNTKKAHLGLFVLGGSFSEGVDFQGDLLNGVVIVGVGLPMVNIENNIIEEYFEEKYGAGFDYAYTYPGFNKVVQAAGRVIRSEYDRGVVILVDERYKYQIYKSLMPDFWSHKITLNSIGMIKNNIKSFFDDDSDIIM